MVKEIKTPYDNPSAELSMAARGGFAQQAVAYRRGYADAEAQYVKLVKTLALLAQKLCTLGDNAKVSPELYPYLKEIYSETFDALTKLSGDADDCEPA